jgi:predicted PurR-regulated permease PerM
MTASPTPSDIPAAIISPTAAEHAQAQPAPTAPADHGPAARATAEPGGALFQVMPGVQRFVLSAAALALGILGLYAGQVVLIPLALAALLAFVLDPLVTWLRRWSVPRALAVSVVMAVALSLLVGAGGLMTQQVSELAKELPTHRRNIQKKLRDLRPALAPSGSTREVAKVFGMVEGEIASAQKALQMDTKREPEPMRVSVDPDGGRSLSVQLLSTVGVQLASAGLVVVLLFLMLLQRRELRDRLLRLMGGDPHQMADALGESAERVSRYLLAQVMVNLGYGVPMALGLWWIGVPGAWLWGGLAALLRFVPYLGPAVGAIFPLLLAFAVDPGWSMVLWTLGLVALLELASNNIVEPLVYGDRTGVSSLAVLLSAAFWAALWGPIGLVLAMPLTVCLVVIGRHLAPLRFLDVLLSSEPVFDGATQLYHRLIAGDLDEAEDMAYQEVKQRSLLDFYGATALPMLVLAARQQARGASTVQRQRLLDGTARFVRELRADDAAAQASSAQPASTLCMGLRTDLDALSAEMLAHALAQAGHPTRALPLEGWGETVAQDPGAMAVRRIHLCTLSTTPQTQARLMCRRLRRHWPAAEIVLVAWCGAESLVATESMAAMGVDAVALQLEAVVERAMKESPPSGDERNADASRAAPHAVVPDA